METNAPPLFTPPRVEPVAAGSVYLFAPAAIPSSFALSAADIKPSTAVLAASPIKVLLDT